MERDGKAVGGWLLILLGAALSLAVPAAGDLRAVLAGGGNGSQSLRHATVGTAVRQLMTTVEDVSSALEMIGTELEELQRRILGGGVGDGALVPNQARCLKKGCPAPGGPYVGRGCDAYNRCQGGTPSKLRK